MADITQRVVWTPCPAGLSGDGQSLLINLHVSPRLILPAGTVPADLSHFPVWQDWPNVLTTAAFSVSGLAAEPIAASRDQALERGPAADSGVWQALLPSDTPVIPHAFDDFRGMQVLTYPLAALADEIDALYANLAVGSASGELPQVDTLRRAQDVERFGGTKDGPRLDRLLSVLSDTDTVDALGGAGTMVDLLEAYHRPLAKAVKREARKRRLGDGRPDPRDPHEDATYRTVDRVDLPAPDQFRNTIDFHRIVSAIGQHPLLMRLTGLVIPLAVPRDGIAPGPYTISVSAKWDTRGTVTLDDAPCAVNCVLGTRTFAAASTSSDLREGWLRLADNHAFSLVQLDVDGAGLSLKNFVRTLPRIGEERFDDEGSGGLHQTDAAVRVGTPRLRSSGIQLAQNRRDVAIRGLFASAGSHDDAIGQGVGDGQRPVLSAEDLIKGWRVDVLDESRGDWRSLMRFDGEYTLRNSGRVIESDDEEAMARLAAAATADDDADAETRKILKASEALFAWSGWSLAAPPLGRVVMPDDADPVQEAPATVPDGLPLETRFTAYARSLPTLRFGHSYRVRLRSADLAGWGPGYTSGDADISGVVSPPVRFGRYEPVETPTLTLVAGDAVPAEGESMQRAALRTLDDIARNSTRVRRNLAPARVGHRFAEMHGVIDKGGRPAVDVYDMLVKLDRPFEEIVVETSAWQPPSGAPPLPQPPVQTRYAISNAASQPPYLPDPLAAGCVIRVAGVPGINPGALHFIPFYGDEYDAGRHPRWPEARSFAVVARPGGTFGWDPGRREFVVPLDKAERARLHISAVIHDDGIELLKLKERTIARKGISGWKAIEGAVRRGQHWMFTPQRILELVHAVQRPLITPSLDNLVAYRQPGEVKASVIFLTPLHAKSTARLDVDGQWLEIDDTLPLQPRVSRVSGHGFDRKLARLEAPDNSLRIIGSHVFADTRARRVTYVATATTRFREFMPADIRDDAERLSIKSSARAVWVPSSSTPPAPAVRYIIPTFGWNRSSHGGDQRSWRHGGGLRVYLDRPWFASGSNEMLAVCLPRGSADPQQSAAKSYVTQWGADPAWRSAPVDNIAPAPRHFPRRVESGPLAYAFDGVETAGIEVEDGADLPPFVSGPYRPPGAPASVDVNIVPHAVGYDRERELWYADTVVNPEDAYFPFIRLALARFQPASIFGHHLSPVVLADFAQLAPHRLAIVTPGDAAPRQRLVQVYGHAPSDTPRPPETSFHVELQRLRADGDADLDWVTTDEGQPPPRPRQPPRPGSATVPGHVSRPVATSRRARLSALDPAARIRLAEAERLVAESRFDELFATPGLIDLIRPPLLYQDSLFLPLKAAGERLRLLITEVETYDTGPYPSAERQSRIVYAEAIEL